MTSLSEKSQKYLLQTYAKYPIHLVRGKGSFVWDDRGRKYLDFYGGHAVCLLGHSPDPIIKAVKEQMEELIFYSNIFDLEPAVILAEKLAVTLEPEKYKVYFTNSGSEANETALKIARKTTGRPHIITFKKSFHGRGMYPLAATGIDSYRKYHPDFDSYTSFAELGDIESVKKAYLEGETAAVICESIQSIGGINLAPKEFYQELSRFCREKQILLILDEIHTGLGRTGTFWFSEKLGIYPDVLTTAKGIASGLPLAAVLVKEEVAENIQVGDHATTFGGAPAVCAAGKATLDIILSEGFLERVNENSTYLRSLLNQKGFETLGEGFLVGIKIPGNGSDLVGQALDKGLIIGNSYDPKVVRLMPPLNTSKDEIDQFIGTFSSLF
jgi:acetylornithine/succinyldiaminopimelate/putrescine aminotransferase